MSRPAADGPKRTCAGCGARFVPDPDSASDQVPVEFDWDAKAERLVAVCWAYVCKECQAEHSDDADWWVNL